jgi:hypothetical protein
MSSVTMSTTARSVSKAACSSGWPSWVLVLVLVAWSSWAGGGGEADGGGVVRAEPGVLGRDRGGPGRADRDQIFRCDVPVVGPQVVERIADAGDVVAQQSGGDAARLGQQGLLAFLCVHRFHRVLPTFLAEKMPYGMSGLL